jgi:hypothetical protein
LFVASVPVICWAIDAHMALTASHVLGSMLLVLAVITWVWRRPALPLDPAVWWLFAFAGVAAISVARVQLAPDIQMFGESAHLKSIKQLVGLFFALALFFGLHCVLRWYGLAWHALRSHYWTTVAIALLALAQYAVALADLTSPFANFAVHNSTIGVTRPLSLLYGFPRVSATLIEPSYLATYLMVGWSYWLCTATRRRLGARWGRQLFVWSGVLVGAMTIAAGSRRGYVVMALLAGTAVVWLPDRARRAGLVLACVFAGLVLTGATHAQRVVSSLLPHAPVAAAARAGAKPKTGEAAAASAPPLTVVHAIERMDQSVQYRAASFLVAFRVVRDEPFLGAGYGTSGFYMERYWPPSFTSRPAGRTTLTTMLSHYATIATETGLVGLLCILGVMVSVAMRLYRVWRSAADAARWQVIGVAALGVSYAIGAISGVLITYQMLLWLLILALALSIDVLESGAIVHESSWPSTPAAARRDV